MHNLHNYITTNDMVNDINKFLQSKQIYLDTTIKEARN